MRNPDHQTHSHIFVTTLHPQLTEAMTSVLYLSQSRLES